MITVGLRIDVDTLRGTRDGVPALVTLLAKYGITATFFMSVGPDNMGRHLWRLFKPQFLWKMLRSNAASLYGYDILLRGTAWPGPVIGRKCAPILRLPKEAGHEVGLHAWDHYAWQMHIDRFSKDAMRTQLRLGFDMLADILGEAPRCSAAAGWRCNDMALLLKEELGFSYNSDCRGMSIFRPAVAGERLAPQIPVTLPTYDEIVGRRGIDDANYNEYILNLCKAGRLNVYAIHAEVEGISHLEAFERMLVLASQRGIVFRPLHTILSGVNFDNIMENSIMSKSIEGREGWVAQQAGAKH